jgi:serine/threonine-protein kinase HipA
MQLVRGGAHPAILDHAVESLVTSTQTPTYLPPAQPGLRPYPAGAFINRRHSQRTRVRTQAIIGNAASARPSTAIAVIGDDLGERRVGKTRPG